ncbi:hypothetical protein GX441_01955, partial [bacterium]|nr:hypothetical protein [bacterium]
MKKIVFLTLPIFLALYAGEGWVRTYGTENTDVATCVQQTSDGGYIAVGYRDLYYGPGYSHIWLLKTDSNGDTSWTRIYGKGFIIKEGYTKANWVEQTLDGGYVIVASTRSFGDSWSIWLLKT